MSAQIQILKQIPLRLNPAGIVGGYVITLLAVVAGAVAFPFSIISTVLLFMVIGAFFAVTVPVIIMTYLFLTIFIYRRLVSFGCRLVYGPDHHAVLEPMSKPSHNEKSRSAQQTNIGVWDRWIDGI